MNDELLKRTQDFLIACNEINKQMEEANRKYKGLSLALEEAIELWIQEAVKRKREESK